MLIILVISGSAFGQTKYTSTDSVCAGSQDVVYGIMNPTPGSTYQWTLSGGGTLDASLNAPDTLVQVDWGTTVGTYNLSVVEVSSNGCFGDTISLDIVINALPTIALVGDSICANDGALVQATLTGTGPWIIDYTDGTGNYTDTATTTTWTLDNLPTYATAQTITVSSLEDLGTGCQADASTLPNTSIYVYPKPNTGQIFHY